MATLTADRVEQLTKACLYADDEWPGAVTRDNAPEGAVFAEGILHTFAFNPDKLAEHKVEIGELLAELPTEFQMSGGGGWTFLNACMDRHGNQWTGLHLTMERLFCLGIATGQARWQLPREMWPALPGGMPYVSVGETRAAA